MEPDSAVAQNAPAPKQLPAPGEHVLIRCPSCRCLAYRDAEGAWRSVFGNRIIPEVLEVIPALNGEAGLPPPKDGIDRLLDQVDLLPPAPRVLPRLLSVLSNTETDLNQVVELVAIDTALTAKLLRTCNSACFGTLRPVNDVAEAVHVLGFQAVYRVVAVATGGNCFKTIGSRGVNADWLWRHSVTTAFAAQLVAEEVGLDGSLLFTAGILHDLGKIILAAAQKEAGILQIFGTEEANREALRLEMATYGFSHAEIGGRMLERWHFSDQLATSIKYHHDPGAGGGAARFAACISLADAVALCLGGTTAAEPVTSIEAQTAMDILGLAEQQLVCYHERIKENLRFVEGMCRL
jgi:putative nucleotidyltransferase with HDIG domain